MNSLTACIISLLDNKLDKNQGAENSGKVIGIDDDGDANPINIKILPDISESDNNKILQVIDGTPTWVSIVEAESLVVQKYYTGNTDPELSLGNDGDLYLKI